MTRQLQFEFVEIPPGSEKPYPSSELDGLGFLWLKSKARETSGISTVIADESRLLEEIVSGANLASALLHVASNQGAAGVDGQSVDEVVAKAAKLIPRLRHQLLEGLYRPSEVRRVWIPKPGGGERGLGIPTVLDRWVQQAIHQVLAPIFEPTFHDSSHGFRPLRGARTAIPEAAALVNAGHEWVVSLDLSKFFDRVNHQRLLSRLGQRVSDKRVLRLILQMLKAKTVLPDGTKVAQEEGTPQGGPLSPLLSNIVLDELDWELERRGLRFVRYADDLNVFVRSERAGTRVRGGLTRFVEQRLRLKVNEDKTVVERPENVHILGFSLRKNEEKGITDILLSKRTKDRIRSKVRELTPRNWGQSVMACLEEINQYLEGWITYFCLVTNEERTLRHVDAHIRRRVRAIIIKQKSRKGASSLFRHLVKQGATVKAASKLAYDSCGIWYKSFRPGVTLAYRNHWFTDKLTSIGMRWFQINAPPPTKAVSGQLTFDF